MGKRSRTKQARRTQTAAPGAAAGTAEATVGPRQPCPCGSGRRYKACHGSDDAATPFVSRTFAGLPGECDWVALREFVPAASAPVRLADSTRDLTVCSLLPMTSPALVRDDGAVWVGLQVQHDSGDASRDLARAVELASDAEPGSAVAMHDLPGPGPRMQDLVADDATFDVTVHDGFDFWVADVDDPTGEVAASLENANAAMTPTARLTTVEAAYWCDVGTKEHLRWVMPYEEDRLLGALARLHASGADALVEGSRLVGSFRAHGLLVPVWDLPVGTGAEALEDPAESFAERLDAALAEDAPLTSGERSALAGLRNRQLTIR
ncbi:MAG TPA: DUF5926 family protein [Nocardioidaceae bacterium]|nr:DUF5926 family protein [Nocardioidaceae bacterium]